MLLAARDWDDAASTRLHGPRAAVAPQSSPAPAPRLEGLLTRTITDFTSRIEPALRGRAPRGPPIPGPMTLVTIF